MMSEYQHTLTPELAAIARRAAARKTDPVPISRAVLTEFADRLVELDATNADLRLNWTGANDELAQIHDALPPCPTCGGDGETGDGSAYPVLCTGCNGTGKVSIERLVARWNAVQQIQPADCPNNLQDTLDHLRFVVSLVLFSMRCDAVTVELPPCPTCGGKGYHVHCNGCGTTWADRDDDYSCSCVCAIGDRNHEAWVQCPCPAKCVDGKVSIEQLVARWNALTVETVAVWFEQHLTFDAFRDLTDTQLAESLLDYLRSGR